MKPTLTRRDWLKGITGSCLIAGVGRSSLSAAPAADRNRVPRENEFPGTTDWLLEKTRVDPESYCRCPWIEGYCSATSVRPGDRLNLMISTAPAAPFILDLYRLGYYQGKGGRHLRRLGPFQGNPQPDPPVGKNRLRECRWAPTVELDIPSDWTSGVYLGKLTEQREGLQSYVIFIVRDDRPCDFLFQCSDTTWAAYNRWPKFYSLYDDGTTGKSGWYTGPGVSVSFDRPYGKYRQIFDNPLSLGSGEFLLWEFPLAYWMEKEGYDVSYISNVDTHADPQGLLRAKAFLSVGHDEYWSLQMYDHVKQAVASGVHAAFFSGNSVDGVIEFAPNRAGTPHRSITRIGKFAGVDSEREAAYEGEWTRHGPNPAGLMGARTTTPANGGADWTCVNEDHWLFKGTGMRNGESIPGLVGWEHHGHPADKPSLEVLARGPVFSSGKSQGTEYTATIYTAPKGNLVFNAATIWWSDGLSEPPGYMRPTAHGNTPPGPDPRVQQITKNLFQRFLNPPAGR